jgi:uncharacterized protein YegJ (DUF2314 family)
VELPAHDARVAQAKAQAQRHWNEFSASFRSRPSLDHEVKVPFPTADGSREHLWVHVTSLAGPRVAGTIANDPIGDVGYVYGDRVRLARADVEDWMVNDGGRTVAGYFSREAVAGG